MSGLVAAAGFLTRIPVPQRPDALGRAAPWFPVVGLVVGLVLAGVYSAAYQVLPSPLASLIAISVGLLLTGAFHEDGLADTADAFGSGATGDRALEIMRDSRLGTYGTAALSISIVWRVLAVGSLGPEIALAGLVVAHSLGRAGAITLMVLAPPARSDGLGVLAIGRRGALVGVLFALLVSGAALGWWAIPGLVLVGIGVWWWRRASLSKVGGITGDVLGACEQTGEVLILTLVAAASWTGSSLWWA